MKKIITLLVVGTISLSATAQQESIPMTKQQFLETYENMVSQDKKYAQKGSSMSDEIMKKRLSTEDYSNYKDEEEEFENSIIMSWQNA